jgi:hypothetical protein
MDALWGLPLARAKELVDGPNFGGRLLEAHRFYRWAVSCEWFFVLGIALSGCPSRVGWSILLGRLTSPIPELRVKTHDRGLGDGGAARRHSLGGIIVMIMFPSVNTALVSMDFLGSFIALVRPWQGVLSAVHEPKREGRWPFPSIAWCVEMMRCLVIL